ncbi:hypothetical protein ACFQVA_05130 [Actinomadura keratinilytica]
MSGTIEIGSPPPEAGTPSSISTIMTGTIAARPMVRVKARGQGHAEDGGRARADQQAGVPVHRADQHVEEEPEPHRHAHGPPRQQRQELPEPAQLGAPPRSTAMIRNPAMIQDIAT